MHVHAKVLLAFYCFKSNYLGYPTVLNRFSTNIIQRIYLTNMLKKDLKNKEKFISFMGLDCKLTRCRHLADMGWPSWEMLH